MELVFEMDENGKVKFTVPRLIEAMASLTDDERMEVMGHFCKYCGSSVLPCYCSADD